MARLLHKLGLFSARRPLAMLGVWAVAIVVIGLAVITLGSRTSNDLSLPGTGSQAVKDLLTEKFPPQQNGTNPIVFDVSEGKLTDQEYKQAITDAVKGMRKAPHVYSVTNPLSSSGQTAGLLSKDKQTAFAPVLLDIDSSVLDAPTAQRVFDEATEPAAKAGIAVAAGGSIGSELSSDESEKSEVIGIIAAMVILSLVLGSLVAMGLPILTAIIGLGIALSVIGLLGHLFSVPTTGPTLATMVGLGVGIDYALFMITRHQDQLRDGMPITESIARTVATSGSAIVFAGSTVVIALVSLGVAGIPLISVLGAVSAIGVVTAVLGAITLLPAFLGLLGPKINSFAIPAFMRPKPKPDGGMWGAWAGVVSRHPYWVTGIAVALLIPLIIPAFSLKLGQEDIGATDPSTTERQAFDMIEAGFGVGYNGPLQIASELTPAATPSDEYTKKYNKATSLQKQLEQDQKELPKEKKELEQQQKQLEQQQKQLVKQQAELEQEQAELEQEGAQLQQQQADLEQQAAQLKDQKRELKAEARQLRAEQARLEQRKERLQSQQEQIREEARALYEEARPLVRQLGRLTAREEVLERRIERLDGHPRRQAKLRERLQRTREHADEVRQQLQPYEQQAEKLAARERALIERAEKLKSQADALQAEAADLQAQQADLEDQAAELTSEGDALQAEADALQQQGDELQAAGESLREQGDELQQQGAELQQQADELKAEQQQAEQQQKQAEKLQQQLTDMLTQAGGDPRNTDPRVVALQNALLATPGVVTLTLPLTNKPGDVVLLSAVPSTAPASDETADLVGTVRDDVIPPVEDDGGITSYVGGFTASYVDLATLITNRLLLVIGVVIMLGFLLLMIAFRSILIPLQAAITNVLSAGAAFGVLTATFQWGWGISLVGIDTPDSSVPIASYVPLMMFAVLFGLSMDYEVFLVSHIQAHHHAGELPRQAVASGLRGSARITTAAALIMASVFASFILNGDPVIKQFGVGLSVAVLLAGILVVSVAPAVISLFGSAAWWLPRWLDRLLPHISVEGETEPPAAADDSSLDDPPPGPAPSPAPTIARETPPA